MLRLRLFTLGGLGRQWLISEGSCRLDRIELRWLVLLLIGAGAIAELLPRQVVPNVYCSLLRVVLTLSIVDIDSVHRTTSQVHDFRKVSLSVAFWLLVCVSLVVEGLDSRIGLLWLPRQVARVHLIRAVRPVRHLSDMIAVVWGRLDAMGVGQIPRVRVVTAAQLAS